MGLMDEPIETGQIDHRTPRARGLPHEQAAVKSWKGGGQVRSPLWPVRPQLPLSKLHPWVMTGSSWGEGSEPEKVEEVMRKGHDSPSSKLLPPKVPTPHPSRLSSTGTDSHLPEQVRDIAPICENLTSSLLENEETPGRRPSRGEPGLDEDWRLEPLELKEFREKREAAEEARRVPEEEAAEADCLTPFAEERFFSTAELVSSFTWVNDSLITESVNRDRDEGVASNECFTDAWVEAGR